MTKRSRVVVGLAATFVLGILMVAVALGPTSNLTQGLVAQTITDTGTRRDAPLRLDAQTFRDIARAQMPMVVNIRTESRRQTRDLRDFFRGHEWLERFFEVPLPSEPREQITEGAGTGFIIDDSGLILTNNHVVAGASNITVALYADEDAREYDARLVGRDPLTDSALIELTEKPGRPLPTAKLGKSSEVRPGDWVMAIGNPFNLEHTVTVGVISAIDRPFPVAESRWQDVLQTDAAINRGNSGGPLLSVRGEVIGMNTAILSSRPAAGNLGVGFAIPIDVVSELLPDLRRGSITRGQIGVQISPVTHDLAEPLGLDAAHGALVRRVERDGPAAAAGIEPGDVIVRYNDRPIAKSDDLVEAVTRTKPGTTVPVEVARNGQRKTLQVTVEALELDHVHRRVGGREETRCGLTLRDMSPDLVRRLNLPVDGGGVLIAEVEQGSPAASAGLRAGDLILEVNRTSVTSATEAAAALRRQPENETAFLLIRRGGQVLFVPVRPS